MRHVRPIAAVLLNRKGSAVLAADLRTALTWRPDDGKFRLLAVILLIVFALYGVTFFVIETRRLATQPFGDFFGLWSCARFVFDHPAAQVYDAETLRAAQIGLGMEPNGSYPFPYPPSFLLALWPLGLLPYGQAYVVTMTLTLALYLWATVGARWRSPMAIAALLAPTTTITIVAGQTGFLAAALLAGGCRLALRRPIAAGVLFGLLTYKPQLGLLVPISLVSAALASPSLWRAVLAAVTTLVVSIAISSTAFGPGIWPAWIAGLPRYSQQFSDQSGHIAHFMPTVFVSLLQLGSSTAAAGLAQFGAAAIAAWIVWRCCRAGFTPLAAAALMTASFVATPHAFVYDMPILATAILWMIAECHLAGDAFGTGEIFIMILAMIAPVMLVAGTSVFPIAPISLMLLLLVIARRSRRRQRSGVAVATPG